MEQATILRNAIAPNTQAGAKSTKCMLIQRDVNQTVLDNTVECNKKQTEVTRCGSVKLYTDLCPV